MPSPPEKRSLRPRFSLRLKTIAFVSAIMVVSAGALGTIIQREWITAQHAQFVEHAKGRAQAAGASSEYGVLAKNPESLQGVVDFFSGEPDILYVFIRDATGTMLAEGGAVPPALSTARRAAIDAQVLTDDDMRVHPLESTSVAIGRFEVSVPLHWERPTEDLSPEAMLLGIQPLMQRERIGVVQVGFSVDTLLRKRAETRRIIVVYTLAITAMAVGLSALLAGLTVNPIRRLVEATRQVAAGDLTIRVPVRTADEIGALAESFNVMTDELRESREELDSYHRTLEFQVAERTDALRMANEELRRINDELAQANRLKSEFLANMSHELRTPLNAIIGFSELLTDEVFGPLNSKQQRYVENVHSSGRHLLNLINEILDLAKVESGKMELQPEPFNPEAAITDITNIVRGMAQKKQLTLVVEAPHPLGQVIADPKRFKQILYNLLSNAVKFTPDRGEVRVHATLEPPGPTPRWLQIAVIDTGIGIAEKDQERVFNEFEQVDGTHAREYAGTGLGLALTRTLVELHGGTITLESVLNQGSTFTVTLPLKRPEGAPPPASDAAAEITVVYVGTGSEGARDVLEALHEENAYTVQWLTPDESVIDRAHALHPRIVVLDLTDDPAIAYRLWHTLHTHPATANVPTILFIPPGVEAEGFALCAAAHFTKPVDKEQLLRKVRTLLPADESRPARILVVDDDLQYLDLTRDVLEKEGYEVHTAQNGALGIDALATHPPDLVLLDLMMPEVNGFEVVAHMRSCPATANIPIVVVTAKDLTPEDLRALNGQVASIAQKGLFSREDLLQEIRRAYSQALA